MAVQQRQAALRRGARLAARVPVRARGAGDGLGGAGAARGEGLGGPARARQRRPRPLSPRHEHRISRTHGGVDRRFAHQHAALRAPDARTMTPAALEWLARFRRYMSSERRLSAHTDSSYARDLAALAKFCDRAGLGDWSALDTQHVRTLAAHSHAAGLAPRSIQRRLSAVRSFYEFLLREARNGAAGASSAPAAGRRRRRERVTRQPGHDVSAPRAARRLPQTLDADQMARLLQIPPGDGLSTRDRAIMELVYSSCLRLGELVVLDVTRLHR